MTGKKLDNSLHAKKYSVVNKPILTLNWASTRKIRNINFDLYKGEIIGVAGLANSGQSELLRMILGIDVLTSGSMRLEQKSFKPKNPNNIFVGVFFLIIFALHPQTSHLLLQTQGMLRLLHQRQ